MSNTGFHSYGNAWRLSDVTSMSRLEFRHKASMYIACLINKTFHSSVSELFLQRHLNI
jgi:hypothetical protein